ncbi:MAG: DUF4365 domain-containing protein [Winogradskyella sp.]|uniref:DUF4365 domain-containing protein n=1 Tax=Winogradskyella sp. TaxID=1883156 RepID=UPI00385ACE5C
MRYNSTERIGVNATERIFIRDFDWIFREQPIVDVGIDALIEQSENGNPTGKFIALQIKSGKGNFSVSSNKLTYYISNIHYNYWLNFDIPILLIAHIPETNKTYWIEITDRNIKPTKKQWKIEIPLKNKLESKAKPLITKLLTKLNTEYQSIKIFNGENVDEETIYDIAEKSECISDSNESTIKTAEILTELSAKTDESNAKFTHFNEIGKSYKSPQVKASINTFAKQINIFAKRLENENQIFAETFAEGIFAFEQGIMIHYLLSQNEKFAKNSIKSVEGIPSALDKTIDAVLFMRTSFAKIPFLNNNLKEAQNTMLTVIDSILNDYKDAKTITLNLIKSTELMIKNNR